MAYITSETVKKIRNALKAEFPEIKFSVTKRDHSEINVAIMKSPYFTDGEHRGINHYWIKESVNDGEKVRQVVTRIDEIIRLVGNYFDKSDSMTDYFHCAFYYNISVGKFDKPHLKVET